MSALTATDVHTLRDAPTHGPSVSPEDLGGRGWGRAQSNADTAQSWGFLPRARTECVEFIRHLPARSPLF